MEPRKRLLAHLANGVPGLIVELQYFRNSTQMAQAEKIAMQEPMDRPTIAQRHGTWKAKLPRKHHWSCTCHKCLPHRALPGPEPKLD